MVKRDHRDCRGVRQMVSCFFKPKNRRQRVGRTPDSRLDRRRLIEGGKIAGKLFVAAPQTGDAWPNDPDHDNKSEMKEEGDFSGRLNLYGLRPDEHESGIDGQRDKCRRKRLFGVFRRTSERVGGTWPSQERLPCRGQVSGDSCHINMPCCTIRRAWLMTNSKIVRPTAAPSGILSATRATNTW